MGIFSQRLKELLEEANKTQVQICAELNIKKQVLTNWKSGYSEPNYDDLVMLADYFCVTTDFLLGRNNY